jgi:hypothetical protein
MAGAARADQCAMWSMSGAGIWGVRGSRDEVAASRAIEHTAEVHRCTQAPGRRAPRWLAGWRAVVSCVLQASFGPYYILLHVLKLLAALRRAVAFGCATVRALSCG